MITTKRAKRILFMLIIVGILFSLPVQAFAKSKAAKKALKAYKNMLSEEKIYIVPANTNFWDVTYDDSLLQDPQFLKRLGDTVSTDWEYDSEDGWYPGDDEIFILKYSRQSDIDFAVAYIDNDSIPELILRRPARKGCSCAYVYTFRKGKVVKVKYPFSKMMHGRDGSMTEITGYYEKKGIFTFDVVVGAYTYYLRLKSGKAKMIAWFDGDTDYPTIPATKAKFRSTLNKYSKGKKKTKIKWHTNTPVNREKYLR